MWGDIPIQQRVAFERREKSSLPDQQYIDHADVIDEFILSINNGSLKKSAHLGSKKGAGTAYPSLENLEPNLRATVGALAPAPRLCTQHTSMPPLTHCASVLVVLRADSDHYKQWLDGAEQDLDGFDDDELREAEEADETLDDVESDAEQAEVAHPPPPTPPSHLPSTHHHHPPPTTTHPSPPHMRR